MTKSTDDRVHLTAAQELAAEYDPIPLAKALFSELDEEERSATADAVSRVLIAFDIVPTPNAQSAGMPVPSSTRADRYIQGRTYRVVEFDNQVYGAHNSATLGWALIERLRADGHRSAASSVATELADVLGEEGRAEKHSAPLESVPDPQSASTVDVIRRDPQMKQSRLVDLREPPWTATEMRQLLDALMNAYSVDHAKFLAKTAGVVLSRWNDKQAPVAAWSDLLEITMAQGLLQQLLERGIDDPNVRAYHDTFRSFLDLRIDVLTSLTSVESAPGKAVANQMKAIAEMNRRLAETSRSWRNKRVV